MAMYTEDLRSTLITYVRSQAWYAPCNPSTGEKEKVDPPSLLTWHPRKLVSSRKVVDFVSKTRWVVS